MIYHGFQYYRTALRLIPIAFPFRPLTLFTRNRSPVSQLSYWYRPHSSRSKLPIVFLHGIGIGLLPYRHFLAALNEGKNAGDDEDVGIIAVELLPISFRITHASLQKEEMCRQIQIILDKHRFDKFVLVAHS